MFPYFSPTIILNLYLCCIFHKTFWTLLLICESWLRGQSCFHTPHQLCLLVFSDCSPLLSPSPLLIGGQSSTIMCFCLHNQQDPSCLQFSSVQFSCSVISDSLQPHVHSTAGLPVHYQLPEFTQTHVHRVSDVIQPSHPLSSPSPPSPNPSQHQGLFH